MFSSAKTFLLLTLFLVTVSLLPSCAAVPANYLKLEEDPTFVSLFVYYDIVMILIKLSSIGFSVNSKITHLQSVLRRLSVLVVVAIIAVILVMAHAIAIMVHVMKILIRQNLKQSKTRVVVHYDLLSFFFGIMTTN